MQDHKFEWDDDKAAQNELVHHVSFDIALEAFDDPFAVDWLDEREDYGEDRFSLLGMAQGRLIYVCYTMRGERTRIISARAAEAFERRWYHEQDS
jgi:hypothetical protein